MPPDALQMATASDVISAVDSVPVLPWATVVIWSVRSFPAPSGNADVKPASCG